MRVPSIQVAVVDVINVDRAPPLVAELARGRSNLEGHHPIRAQLDDALHDAFEWWLSV